MKQKRLCVIALVLLAFCWGHAQRFHIPTQKRFVKLKFELVNNLMVVPVELNGASLNFILDTGVSHPILFNLSQQDSISINKVSEVSIKGLGGGAPITALRSTNNVFKVGGAVSNNQMVYVVLDKDLNLSAALGTPVHGIIGYDIFRDFVVEINYAAAYLKLYRPQAYRYKKSKKRETLPLVMVGKKAFVGAAVTKEDDSEVPVKLLVDTGSSDALWLFEDAANGAAVPDAFYEDFLGVGLGGDIYGKRTKIKGLRLGSFLLAGAKVAFPSKASFAGVKKFADRNGSVGGEVLKRFNIVFDYPHHKISLVKNRYYSAPFRYNLSGLAIQHNGVRYISERIAQQGGVLKVAQDRSFGNVQLLNSYDTRLSLVPEIVVSGIRAGSPAAKAGLQEGDVILAVNGKQVHNLKLQEVIGMLNARKGKRVRVLIERYQKNVLYSFVLKELFAHKKP